jgi:hypothetical protein
MDHHTSRRDLLLTSLMAALPLGASAAAASPLKSRTDHHQAAGRAAMENLFASAEGRIVPRGG